jgi:pyruvate dehydrogenase E1 component alpha subunit
MDHLELHRRMLRIRLVEEQIAGVYGEQEMRCPVHLSIGQEGAAVGVCSQLREDDLALSGHRAHAHYMAKGGDLHAMLAEMYGRATGCCGGRGGSMHLVDLDAGFVASTPIVGSTMPIGVGVAFAAARAGEDRVVVIFHGEAAMEEGVFHESLNFAAVHKLPVVFACENNLYSVYTPLGPRQPSNRPVRALAAAHGVHIGHGNGNDVLETAQLAREAIEHARSGAGPAFLELATYRHREHCGPNFDDDLGYRAPEEASEWLSRDPLELSRTRLLPEVGAERLEAMAAELAAEVEEGFRYAKQSPMPDPERAGDEVYA